MLPFKNRLVKRKDFEKVHKIGQFFSEANIAIKVAPNGMPDTRVGVIVGLKFSKRAVERNQMKRQLRDMAQKKLKDMKKGMDVAVMIRKRDGERVFANKLQKNMESVLIKSGLINEK